jgi:hypothetical protein
MTQLEARKGKANVNPRIWVSWNPPGREYSKIKLWNPPDYRNPPERVKNLESTKL